MWTTKDGRKIRICDMGDQHLLNAIKFCRRTTQAKLDYVINNPPNFQGEYAQLFAEQEWESYLHMDAHDVINSTLWGHLFDAMLLEADRRGLEL